MTQMTKLYNRSIDPSCAYCLFGRKAPDDDAILCIKRGIMKPSSSCTAFRYDPLKREPKPRPKICRDYSPKDFDL